MKIEITTWLEKVLVFGDFKYNLIMKKNVIRDFEIKLGSGKKMLSEISNISLLEIKCVIRYLKR